MKKLVFIGLMCGILITLSGCFKRDQLEDIDIYTSVYPLEYITNKLYGEHSTIYSIYPDGVTISDYELTNKQIEDYSKAGIYIFNGLGKDKDYVQPMFNYNNDLKIIDASMTMEYIYDVRELWLDPSNFLMLVQNISNGLQEYISNHYLQQNIEANYESLKIDVSKLDASIRLMAESSNSKTIVVANDALKFLDKYGINVISLSEDSVNDKVLANVNELIDNGTIEQIFILNSDSENDYVKQIVEETNIAVTKIHSVSNITSEERNAKKDYLSIMYENLDLLKDELYD